MINNLTELDFSPGIRARDINENFNLIHDWLIRERLRCGGYGIVEGFEMSADPKTFSIRIGRGLMINQAGEEVEIPEKIIQAQPLDIFPVRETLTLTDGDDYSIELSERPYSDVAGGFINYNPPKTEFRPGSEEFVIRDLSDGTAQVSYIQITGKKVYFRKSQNLYGHELEIEYKTTKGRIDSIMLSKAGIYRCEEGVVSLSPSHVQLKDYDNYYMIGAVYWDVDLSVKGEIFTDHRTYRPVYVDPDDRLYLMGKLYKEPRIIYMTEPENPIEDDLWYDSSTNTLNIWKEEGGLWGWVLVNDMSSIPVRDSKLFMGDDFPTDFQTFLFKEDEVNLRFIPGNNEVDVIIDNAPLMSDQYEEVIQAGGNNYTSDGIGIRLKAPLDRYTPVQIIVTHCVRNRPVRETFQRGAVFISENHVYYSEDNTEKVFETVQPYSVGEHQLEVFLDGRRLINGAEVIEMVSKDKAAAASDKGKMSKYFRVIAKIKAGQFVAHKISRWVWSFDQLDTMLKKAETDMKAAVDLCEGLRRDLDSLNENTAKRFEDFEGEIRILNTRCDGMADYFNKGDIIPAENLSDEIRGKIVAGTISVTMETTALEDIPGCRVSDFLQVFYISKNLNRALLPEIEYSLSQAGDNVRIALIPELVSSGASILVTGIRIGVE